MTTTLTRSVSPTASSASSASVPRTVRSARAEVTGTSVIRAGTPGAASTTSTTGELSTSPKSIRSGLPQ